MALLNFVASDPPTPFSEQNGYTHAYNRDPSSSSTQEQHQLLEEAGPHVS